MAVSVVGCSRPDRAPVADLVESPVEFVLREAIHIVVEDARKWNPHVTVVGFLPIRETELYERLSIATPPEVKAAYEAFRRVDAPLHPGGLRRLVLDDYSDRMDVMEIELLAIEELRPSRYEELSMGIIESKPANAFQTLRDSLSRVLPSVDMFPVGQVCGINRADRQCAVDADLSRQFFGPRRAAHEATGPDGVDCGQHLLLVLDHPGPAGAAALGRVPRSR